MAWILVKTLRCEEMHNLPDFGDLTSHQQGNHHNLLDTGPPGQGFAFPDLAHYKGGTEVVLLYQL